MLKEFKEFAMKGNVVDLAVGLILGVVVIFGSLLIYRGRYSSGGILNLLLGIFLLIYGPSQLGGVLALISGVVGLLATEARS